MTLQFSATARNAMLDDGITAIIGNAGLLRIYSGSAPANVAAAPTGTLLAELTMATPFAPGAVAGVLTPGAITQDSGADATETAGYFRMLTSGGTAVLQGTVTATGGGGDLTLSTTSIVAGVPVLVTGGVITAPGA